jgi:DNA-binding CsgD family transcriptional regulator
MEHLYFFYFLITVFFGIVSLSVAVTLYVKTKEQLVRYYLYYYVVFTLLVVLSTLLSYISVNLSPINPNVWDVLEYLFYPLSFYLLIYTIPMFNHYLVSASYTRIRNAILGGIVLLMFLSQHLSEYVIGDYEFAHRIKSLGYMLLFVVKVYSLVLKLYYLRRIHDQVRKSLTKKYAIWDALLLPGNAYDVLLGRATLVPVFPVIYCGMSVIFTHHFIKYYFRLYSPVPKNSMSVQLLMPDNGFFDHYNISPREREIIALLIQDYKNKQIGETLYISVNTVKTHIRNIYAKLDVKNRHELLALLKYAQEDSTGKV